jgi:hypothetical protein
MPSSLPEQAKACLPVSDLLPPRLMLASEWDSGRQSAIDPNQLNQPVPRPIAPQFKRFSKLTASATPPEIEAIETAYWMHPDDCDPVTVNNYK